MFKRKNDEPVVLEQKGKLKLFFIVILFVIILIMTVLLLFRTGILEFSFDSKDEINRELVSYRGADGKSYVSMLNGDFIIFEDGVNEAFVTPDRKHVVAITNNGELNIIDKKTEEKTVVSENGRNIYLVHNKGLVYSDSKGEYHRYLFKDKTDVIFGNAQEVLASSANLHIAFVNDDIIYMLKEASIEKEKIGKVNDICNLLNVSNDGKTVLFELDKEDEKVVYALVKDNKTKLGTFDTVQSYSSTYVIQNKGQDYSVIVNDESDNVFIVNKKADVITAKVKNKVYPYTNLYTANGLLEDDKASKFAGVYICEDALEEKNLFFIDNNGERDKVIGNIGQYTIFEGNLFYIDENKNLRKAKLNGGEIVAEEKIAGDVSIIYPGCINGYIYYLTNANVEEKTGDLYVYREGEASKLISEKVECSLDNIKKIYGRISSDGKNFYYFKDKKEDNEALFIRADLYKYTYGTSKSKKIDSDVLVGSLDSGYVSGDINKKAFTYMKYRSEEDNKSHFDWYFFNGRKGEVMVRDAMY